MSIGHCPIQFVDRKSSLV
uniref:Uncharacterized protein n=1 Tax=Anguilla anguilla TaxID=7936 RepID=A0A0E9V508_ANGAN